MISAIFIRRPILASVLSIIVLIAGGVSLRALPINQYPEIAPVQVTVTASYPGADAETVANTVAAPIEQQITGVDNMLYMSSVSTATGQMTITVYFGLGTDPDTAEVQVNNRVAIALPQLPDAVRNTGVKVQKRSTNILMLVAISSPGGRHDAAYVGNYANLYVLDALKRVEGANQAQIIGLPDLAMRIWLNPDRMAGLGLTPSDVAAAISAQNQQFGAGSIGQSPTAEPVELTFPVTTGGRFSEQDEFERIILRSDPNGVATVRVADVGRAELGTQAYLLRSTVNAEPATFVAVYQQPGSNALAVAERVKATLADLETRFPEGIEYSIPYDTTLVIQASIDEVVTTLFIAIVLVVLVTWLFLQSVRATLIPTAAIIVSVLGTFAGMLVLGFSINLLTLFGLVLAIGIVCDDAIVVVENVERNMAELKLGAKDATLRAMNEVIGPVIATTLVLIAVFVPAAFVSGTTGVLYKQFAVTIAISVSISSFAALTLTPALAGILLKPRGKVPLPFRVFNAGLDRLTDLYGVGVRAVLRTGVVALVVPAVMIWLIVVLFGRVPGAFVPDDDQGVLLAAVIMPDAASLDRTEEVTERAAAILREHPAVEYASALSGYSLLDGQLKTNAGGIFVNLKDFDERTDPALGSPAILAAVAPKLAEIAEARVIPIQPPPIPGFGTQGGFEMWVQDQGSGTPVELAATVRKVLAAAAERPELTGLNSTFNPASRQLRLHVDRVKAETLGVPVADVFQALQTLFGSVYVSQFNKYGRVWQVVVQAEPEFRSDPQDIGQVFVRQRDGAMVPLSALVETTWDAGPDLASRFNGFPAARVTGSPAPGYSSGQAIAAMERIAAEVLPDGYGTAWAGQAYEEKQSGGTSAVVFVFGMIMVFLILAAQYEKWTLPIAIVGAVPFGVFGALVAVWAAGMQNDVYFQVGLVTLIGLSTKNAILIVEFAQVKHEQEGLGVFEASLEAAKLRLRPILMTSLSFILGALPLVLASGAGANARHSIGTGIIGGMVAATSLALFFVPLFYLLVTRASKRGGGGAPNAGGSAPPGGPTPAPAAAAGGPSDA